MKNLVPTAYNEVRTSLLASPKRWLVTGVAGFIGSALLNELLASGQEVVGLDNLSTGHESNISDVLEARSEAAARFHFIRGDIRDLTVCREAAREVDYVLHQAALGSVPRSIVDPVTSVQVNVDGFLNVLVAARDAGVRRIVYASSSSVYGDARRFPQIESEIGRPLSPYAATKLTNEIFGQVFQRTYGSEVIGLRYFNVFGPRQDPNGPYAAVIPRWINALLSDQPCHIYGDGETSRDFCFVDNAVQANLLAAVSAPSEASQAAYNIACGESTTLNSLFCMIRDGLAQYGLPASAAQPIHDDFRPGDVARSMAEIHAAREQLGYEPTHRISDGLKETLGWYARRAGLVQ
jgi:UDP-N-acetylglucosamine/UDP-N-acetyl-alpha-D-glucosaminouronate 4-epimerase